MENNERVTIIAQVKIIRDIFFSPERAFKEINKRPEWLIAFLVIGIGTIITNYLILPFANRAATLSIAPDTSYNETEKIGDSWSRLGDDAA